MKNARALVYPVLYNIIEIFSKLFLFFSYIYITLTFKKSQRDTHSKKNELTLSSKGPQSKKKYKQNTSINYVGMSRGT